MNSTPPQLPSEKILIVDDDAVVIKALTMKLKAKGFIVYTAMEGADAVKAVREQKPDLIILDITFPAEMGLPWDGFRIMEWLRRLEGAGSIPIIVISGGEPAKLKDRALKAGAAAFYQKPVDTEELFKTIRSILGKAPGAA
jgi:CheY-like chemotaxis protein